MLIFLGPVIYFSWNMKSGFIFTAIKSTQITQPFPWFLGFSSLQISIGERTMEGSPFSERPVSSHSAYCQQRLEENRQQHKNSIFHPPSSIPEEEKTSNKFQSSFARSLNLPPCAMDERTWLANELLETRQVHKF